MEAKRRNITLKGLEVFQQVAKVGSVQDVAEDTGLSISTVSHHLRSLEDSLGVDLLDHGRRPMVLTPAGVVFLRYVEDGLRMIRRGEFELTSGNLFEARNLRLGIVDDFDSEIAPELAQLLAGAMPRCVFKHFTRPSHEILGLLVDQELDIGVSIRPQNDLPGIIEYPLMRDPFVVATPVSCTWTPAELLAGKGDLPLLRYTNNQMIGRVIETQLRRMRVSLPNRFEFESNQSILGMVASSGGWAITTPASYLRAKRFHKMVQLHPFPGPGFSRTMSLMTTEVYVQAVAETVLAALRRLIRVRFVEPAIAEMPWLASSFFVMPDSATKAMEDGIEF